MATWKCLWFVGWRNQSTKLETQHDFPSGKGEMKKSVGGDNANILEETDNIVGNIFPDYSMMKLSYNEKYT